MKLYDYGIIVGTVLMCLFMGAMHVYSRSYDNATANLYTDECLTSACVDALFDNEDIIGRTSYERVFDRYYESLFYNDSLREGTFLVMYLAPNGIYYVGDGHDVRFESYSGEGRARDIEKLLAIKYEIDMTFSAFGGGAPDIDGETVIAFFENAGEYRAAIGGAAKRKKVSAWNNL